MNPVDHPHGGGEGRAPIGRKKPATPWGFPALGSQNEVRESIEDKHPIKSVTEKFEKTLTPDRFSDQDKCKFFSAKSLYRSNASHC